MTSSYNIQLSAKERGIHIVTQEILSQIPEFPENGLLHLFLQHTSAGIGVNENADPNVRKDFEAFIDKYIPENEPYFTHVEEGPDDMPSHIKSAFVGHELTLPIRNKKLALGTWQGIYLFEFRNHANARRIIATVLH